jgi:hypothetical protein
LRELRAQSAGEGEAAAQSEPGGSDRRRRTRDAVEAALSDVILLGTQEQVRLAARAADEMVAGRPIETAELVMSLRAFIRDVLDLEAITVEFAIPRQGPTRAGGASARGGRADKQGNTGGGGGRGAGGSVGAGEGASHRGGTGDPEGLSGHSSNV